MAGNCKIGWFYGNGQVIHGYGKDSHTKKEGLYEMGSFKSSNDQVNLYDY